jgi:DNA-binding Lrp family transcriptional regulator
MLTSRDKKIIKFMEDKELGLTINQAALMFFPKNFAYDYARQRLRKLWERGVLKRYKSNYSDEYIYFLPEKKPSYHDNAVLNVYSNFVNRSYKITEFKPPEFAWMDGKYKSDAFIKAETEEEIRIIIVEVDLNTTTNIQKYEEWFETKELQRKYGDFPLLLILTDVDRTYKSDYFEIVSMDIKCTDFQKVLI